MATSCVYENDTDRKQHSRAIQRLSEDLGVPEKEIQILYETVLCTLREKARIKDYLVILVCRNVKAIIKGDISPDIPEVEVARRIVKTIEGGFFASSAY